MSGKWRFLLTNDIFIICFVSFFSVPCFCNVVDKKEATNDSGLLITLVTLGYMVILIILSWINYDQRKVAENEFKLHRQQLEKLISQRTSELEIKNAELENKILEIKKLQNSIISQKKLASLGKLSAGIAHEIKNPLNMINNSAKVIVNFVKEQWPMYVEKMGKNLDPVDRIFFTEDMNDLKTVSELIVSSGERANAIINKMLSQVRHGKPDLKMASLQDCLDENLNLVYHTMRALNPFNITIVKELEPLPKIIFDYEDMGRAFVNIFENAFYATREKLKAEGDKYQPTIKIKLIASSQKITISIEDNGTGIKSEIIDNIMEPFFSTKPPGEGTGLGLAMVNDIVIAHGGELKIISKEGDYTKVIIELPVLLKERL